MPRQKKQKTNNSYQNSRYNSVKHGILSAMPVLPWENAKPLEDLKESLIEEYQPNGASEEHLVTELANIIFRKQRVYKAENALIIKEVAYVSKYSLCKEADFMTPQAIGSQGYVSSIKPILYGESKQEEQVNYPKLIQIAQELARSSLSYNELMQKYSNEIIEMWHGYLKDYGYSEDKESFKKFLNQLINDYTNKFNMIQVKPYLKQQAIGVSYIPTSRHDYLYRYEAYLDRKFEKILAMLLKLQEVRQMKHLN